jgi:cytochrome c-type biogenesis protein
MPIRVCVLLIIGVFYAIVGVAAAEDSGSDAFERFLSSRAAENTADGSQPFSADAFAQAQKAGKLIVIHVNAFWCSTCELQRPMLATILAELKKMPDFSDLVLFNVDFDQQKDIVRRFDVHAQSTLIVFRGRVEVGRSIGDTSPDDIRKLLTRAKNTNAPAPSMLLSGGSYALALLAGLLSILSPCVLPLLPIVFGQSLVAHRLGAVALAAGLALSFVAVGMIVSTAGAGIGFDRETIRVLAAMLMILFGTLMLSGFLQERLAFAGLRLETAADQLIHWTHPSGLRGQFMIGVLLGAVWSPCVGPTLGAAIALAGVRATFAQASLVMLLFAVGMAIPLAAIGTVSRQALLRWRGTMEIADHVAKIVFGTLVILIGVAILFGADRDLEALLLHISPSWLTRLTTLA